MKRLLLLLFLFLILPAVRSRKQQEQETLLVPITRVPDSEFTGAVCLDGSPAAYHLDRGFGSGAPNWILHFEGGGWCTNVPACLHRSKTRHGSSWYMDDFLAFTGILSNKPTTNPDFYNWNRVKLRYCDGASFTGDSEYNDGKTVLYFRGQRIWYGIIRDLFRKGLLLAQKGAQKNLNKICLKSRRDPSECFFPQYMLKYIETPYFILNPAYDKCQLVYNLVPPSADPYGHWNACKIKPEACTPDQINVMQGYRSQLLSALRSFKRSKTGGMFINSCFAHCQSEFQHTWFAQDSPRLHNKTVAEAVGDWYFERSTFKEVDCPYPCNPTCHTLETLCEIVE